MTESDIPDAAHAADEWLDPAESAGVQQALGQLAFLRPDGGDPAEPMPMEVWARLSAALAEEAAHRSPPATPTRIAGEPAPRVSRPIRWGGGLIAASVAVVAVGIGMTVVRDQSPDVAVVAGDAGAMSAPALAEALTAPQNLSFAGMVPPVRMLVDSDMDYTATGLRTQVASVLKRFGAGTQEKGVEAAVPAAVDAAALPSTGFTSDEQSLRDCITKLTALADSTALMVDRSTFEGQDAGVVVTPEYGAGAAASAAPDQWRVFVVDPDCELKLAIQITLAP